MEGYFCIECGKGFENGLPSCECYRKIFISIDIQADTIKDAQVALWNAYKKVNENKKKLDLKLVLNKEDYELYLNAYESHQRKN